MVLVTPAVFSIVCACVQAHQAGEVEELLSLVVLWVGHRKVRPGQGFPVWLPA